MKIITEQNQHIQRCATATADLSARLAAAGVMCFYAGSEAIAISVPLLIGSATAGEMTEVYADLAREIPPGDMYDVEYTESVKLELPPSHSELEYLIQDFISRLLHLRVALRNLHLSYERFCATNVALKQNRDDPDGALYQDARLFSVLQQQAIWRNLSLCKRLHDEILFSAPRVNMLWHQYKIGLSNQSRFSLQEVRETFTAAWKERASDITNYQLPAFAITGFGAVLQILEQKGQLANPALLMDERWHKSTYQLAQSFQHSLDTFYTNEVSSNRQSS
jgi:hypothetical protein